MKIPRISRLYSMLTGASILALAGCSNTNIAPIRESAYSLPVEHYLADTLRLPNEDPLIAVSMPKDKTAVVGGKAISPELMVSRVFVPIGEIEGNVISRFLRSSYLQVDPEKSASAHVLIRVDSDGKNFSIPSSRDTDATDNIYLDKKRAIKVDTLTGLELKTESGAEVKTRKVDGEVFAVYAISNNPQLKDAQTKPFAFMKDYQTGDGYLKIKKDGDRVIGEIQDRVSGKEYILAKVEKWAPTEDVLRENRARIAAQIETARQASEKAKAERDALFYKGMEFAEKISRKKDKERTAELNEKTKDSYNAGYTKGYDNGHMQGKKDAVDELCNKAQTQIEEERTRIKAEQDSLSLSTAQQK